MIKKLSKPSLTNVLISLIIMIAIGVFALPLMLKLLESSAGTSITPDSDFFYGPSRLKEIALLYGDNGLIYFTTRFTFDLIWPASYLFFLLSSLNYLLSKLSLDLGKKRLLLLPFAGVFFDLLENTFCSIYLCLAQNNFIAVSAVISSGAKWIIISFLFFVLILFTLILLIKKFTRLLSNQKKESDAF